MARRNNAPNVAIVSEERTPFLKLVMQEMEKVGISAEFVNVGELILYVKDGSPKIRMNEKMFSYEAALLWLPQNFLLFAEPLLQQLASQGTYCQIKPTAFNDLTNRPLLYTTLHLKGVDGLKTSLVSDVDSLKISLKDYDYPLMLEVFVGTERRQRIFIENEKVMSSHLKSMPAKYDLIAVREYATHDLIECFISGKEAIATRSPWNRSKMEHSSKKVPVKLSKKDEELAKKAARCIGCDIALVRIIDDKVVSVRNEFVVDEKLGVHKMIAKHYKGLLL